MHHIGYYLYFFVFYLISLLPWSILYLFSSIIHFILFGIFKYRKKVIADNLRNSFPEKSAKDLQKLHRKFTRYFCDLLVETFKTMSVSPRTLQKRVKFHNLELFERFSAQNQSVSLALGHLGNWELIGAAFAPYPYFQLIVIYHPLKNKIFDRIFYHMRTRLGNGLYPMKNTMRSMLMDRNKLTATAFICDQTPSNPERAYWTQFLNQETPVFRGVAMISRKLNYPVIYVSVQRPRRGYYEVHLKLVSDSPAQTTEDEISEAHTRLLEEDIRRQPEIWLWTHRRWKHSRPANI